jgi:hypothetical protein
MQLQRKVIFEVALLGSFFFLCALLVSTLALADDPVVTVTVGDIEVPPGGVVRAPIMVQNVTALGGGVINITFNSSVIHVTGVTEGGGNALTIGAWNSNNSLNPGYVNIASYSAGITGQHGDVIFADVTYRAMGAVGSSSPLNLSVESLFNYHYVEIYYEIQNGEITTAESNVTGLDTGPGTYPSIGGVHKGSLMPNRAINVSKLYTYPSTGTGGHTEYVRIWDDIALNATATWSGYQTEWQRLTFTQPFTLQAGQTYYYEMRTSSYPQIIHVQTHTTLDGSDITCTSFEDLNGNVYDDWIPAIWLYSDEGGGS